jgi:cysteine desulfurase/selenocysteine lyase
MHIDYLASGTNKGLLGTLGAGFIYCDQRIVKKITPPYAGYQSVVSHVAPPSVTTNFETIEWHPNARRFESGNLSYNCILAIDKGISLILELGIDNIEEHVLKVERYLREKISDIHLHVVQAKNPKHWGGVICVYFPTQAETESAQILKKYKIHATIRAGYIRFGLDFYNTLEQMNAVSKALHEIEEL